MAEIRVELRAKNSALWHCVFDHFSSIRKFTQFHKLSYVEVLLYLNLRRSPYTKSGEPRDPAKKIAAALGMSIDVLFPKAVYLDYIVPAFAVEVDVERFVSLRHATTTSTLLTGPPPDELVDLRDALRKQLDTLTPREQRVIDSLFGLSDGDPKTIEEVAGAQGVTRTRIDQIKAKALGKLRHPSRASVLKPFLRATGKTKPRRKPYRVIHTRHVYSTPDGERLFVCDEIPGLDPKSLKGCMVTVNDHDEDVREVTVAPSGTFSLKVRGSW
jgi:hypothetical protein